VPSGIDRAAWLVDTDILVDVSRGNRQALEFIEGIPDS
jgi:hypothetical protein